MRNVKQEQLFRAILIQNASTSWHQQQMRLVLQEIQQIEDSLLQTPTTSARYEQLQGMLSYLMGKGLFERKLIFTYQDMLRGMS